MKRGFTVLELLVASMLLGMLMTILTTIFSQSSIAWKTGVAGVGNTNDARADISDTRYKADNVYEWNGEKIIQSVFDNSGNVRTERAGSNGYIGDKIGGSDNSGISVSQSTDPQNSYGTATPRRPTNGDGDKNYIVNVMSYGPDRKKETKYDNVYSVSPSDDPSEW